MHRCTESLWPEAKGAYSALALVRTCQRVFVASPRYAIAATHNTPRAGIPLLALLAYYTQYLVRDGSPLIVDFGFDDVPQVIPPGVVWTIFGLLLLPIL